jgi:hypothetical protein
MPHELTCHRCHRPLKIPRGLPGRWLTCPRCLARVRNLEQLDDPQAISGEARAPDDAPVRPRPCPGCGREVDPSWRRCPVCEEPLSGRRDRSPPLDREVGRDTGAGTIILVVLGCVLLGGIGLFLTTGGINLILDVKNPNGGVTWVLGLAVVGALGVGCLAAGIARRSRGAGVAVGVTGGLLGGLLTGLGVVLVIVLTLCFGFLAAFQNFLQTCGKGCH